MWSLDQGIVNRLLSARRAYSVAEAGPVVTLSQTLLRRFSRLDSSILT